MTVRLGNGMQLDLRVVLDKSFGAGMQYFTGSKEHNILIRGMAKDRGLKINEYGVFRGKKQVAGASEQDVYEAVGLSWIPPELREARGEIELAIQRRLPKLLEVTDIRGDLHVHTNVTDGRASLEEMVEAAKKRGHSYVAITDHSKRVTMAKGLDGPRLLQHWKSIDKLAAKLDGIALLKGIEMDILEDGRLDLPDKVLREADWVIASIHYGQKQPREQITRRLLNAIKNPHVSAIGHPTGRLIGRRQSYEVDFEAVFQAAADYGCLMELNSQPDRLDLSDTNLLAAKDKGIQFVVNTDAHAPEEFGFLEYGVNQARRAGLEAKDVANTKMLESFLKLIKNRK